MRRRRFVEYRPFPDELLEGPPYPTRHEIADHLEAAGWDFVDYLQARRQRRLQRAREAAGWNGHGNGPQSPSAA